MASSSLCRDGARGPKRFVVRVRKYVEDAHGLTPGKLFTPPLCFPENRRPLEAALPRDSSHEGASIQ